MIDPDGAELVYVQVANHMARRIESGEWQPNRRQQPERELADFYGVSRATAIATVVDGFRGEIEDSPSFNDLLHAIQSWADEINQVARTPDLWAELRRSREFVVEIQSADIGNTPLLLAHSRQS